MVGRFLVLKIKPDLQIEICSPVIYIVKPHLEIENRDMDIGYLIYTSPEKGFTGTVVNRTCYSLKWGSHEITFTVNSLFG